MNCPVCKTKTLTGKHLEDGPLARFCVTCEGAWIQSDDYEVWLSGREVKPEKAFEPEEFAVQDSKSAKVCPTCKHLLFKYRLRSDIHFHLDHCRSCGGVWFDKGEWEALVSVNLHDEFYKVFTKAYQEGLRSDDQRKAFQDLYKQRLGDEDYERVCAFRSWLEGHPHQQLILGYLAAEDPYRP